MQESQFYTWTIDRETLAILMSRRGFTPPSLAVATGLDKRIIYRLRKGERKHCTYATARTIAKALNVDVSLFADPSMRWAA